MRFVSILLLSGKPNFCNFWGGKFLEKESFML